MTVSLVFHETKFGCIPVRIRCLGKRYRASSECYVGAVGIGDTATEAYRRFKQAMTHRLAAYHAGAVDVGS